MSLQTYDNLNRRFRAGFDDTLFGGLAGVDGSAALTLALLDTLTARPSSSFVLKDAQILVRSAGRTRIEEYDGVTARTLLTTERNVHLSDLNLPLRAFSSLRTIGTASTADGSGNRAMVLAEGFEMEESGMVAAQLPTPTVVTGNPATLDFDGFAHGLQTGDRIRIIGNTSSSSINGEQKVTRTSATAVTIPINVSSAVSDGIFVIDPTQTRSGAVVARGSNPGTISATRYEPIYRVRPGECLELELIHAIANSTNTCSIVLASDSAGTGAVEIARSVSGKAIFEKRLAQVEGNMGTIGTWILLATTSAGSAVSATATVVGQLTTAARNVQTGFAAPSSAGTGALGWSTLFTVPIGRRLLVRSMSVQIGTAAQVSIGVGTSTGGANYLPAIATATDPVSVGNAGLLVEPTSADLYVLGSAYKATAGAGAGVAVADAIWLN